MREQFIQQMDQLADTLTSEARAAAKAMQRAHQALKDANISQAEKVIDSDRDIDLLERSVDEMGVSLLARQAPVASDLRYVVSALRLSSTLERMGDLARHVAFIARGRYPYSALNGEIQELLVKMAAHAAEMGEKVARLVETTDLEIGKEIIDEDDVLDELHEKTFAYVLNNDNELTRQEIIDIVLLGRYLERYGDHGVSVARRIQFMVRGVKEVTDPFAAVNMKEIS